LRRGLFEAFGSDRHSRPSLNNIDRKLSKYLSFRNGVFVEAGANDGYAQSNTYFLEKMLGWKGVLIEPVPALAKECRANRKSSQVYSCALVPRHYEEEAVTLTYANLMTLVHGARKSSEEDEAHVKLGAKIQARVQNYELQSPARTLSSVLDEAQVGEIDFLSLDVEGYEAQVLDGLDFDRYRPRFILVEANFPEEVHARLEAGYDLVEEFSHHDRFYRRK